MLNPCVIPALPLISAFVILCSARYFRKDSSRIAVAALLFSTLLSIIILVQTFSGERADVSVKWLSIRDTNITVGYLVDPLSAMMLFVVCIVSLLVVVYSQGYMHDDPGYERFFIYMSFFAFSMLSLVLANSILLLFIFWELVGLCSYLLIGFWYEKPRAYAAAKKAFLTTKAGDLGLMLGLAVLFCSTETFHFGGIFSSLPYLRPSIVTLSALLVFAGAVGKSAQFPLHVWLPDAMEGPTPVSALIHAATMVAAGVYLVGRTYPLFEASGFASMVVAVVGAVTLLMAATIAVTQYDIKRIIAYSTISQLGYMMLGLGSGGFSSGLFHLMTHAFFKALLFLGAGSVIHAVHTQDIRKMGSLRKVMPITFWTFVIGALANVGIPPLSGFWSKDEILVSALHYNHLLFLIALFGTFLTGFYMFRLVFLCFIVQSKSAHAHESPDVMTYPLICLAVFSAFFGFLGSPLFHNLFQRFIDVYHLHESLQGPDIAVMLISTLFGLAGIYLAYTVYYTKKISSQEIKSRFPSLYTVVHNKYFMDEFYNRIIVRTTYLISTFCNYFDRYVIDGAVNLSAVSVRVVSVIAGLFDRYIIDGFVNFISRLTKSFSYIVRRLQTGNIQNYVAMLMAGWMVLIMLLAVVR